MTRLALAIAVLAAAPALAQDEPDATTLLCLDMKGPPEKLAEICPCVTETFQAEVDEEEAALYEAVGARYLAKKSAGQGMVDAWDAAIAETAAEAGLGRTALLSRMNDVGQIHRAAMGSCM